MRISFKILLKGYYISKIFQKMVEFSNDTEADVILTDDEKQIARQLVVDLSSIQGNFEDIVGQGELANKLRQTVILPLESSRPNQFTCKGVLLHGPASQGISKTLVAKVTARKAGARFISMDMSSLSHKGNIQKLMGSVFTLASKIQPCIIFIKQIDRLLNYRNKDDNEASLKAYFIKLWDSLDMSNSVVVMGTTNRPSDVDTDILRRFPVTIRLGLPDLRQRREILTSVMSTQRLCPCVDMLRLAKVTDGFCELELNNLCKAAVANRLRNLHCEEVRRLTSMEDILVSFDSMRKSRDDNKKELKVFSNVSEDVIFRVSTLGDMIITFASNDEPDIFVTESGDMIITTAADELPAIAVSPCFSSEYVENTDLEGSLM